MKTSHVTAVTLSLFSLTIVACTNNKPQKPTTVDRTSRESTASAILESIATSDWQTLSSFATETGVRFTPQTNVNITSDRVLSPSDIAHFEHDETVYTWGIQDGSGLPIEMTNTEYLARYIWDHDFRTAPEVRWNAVQDHGSMIDNAQDVYPGATTVEYYFPGFDEQYGGMDWRSLRLVLAQGDDGNWMLYGVIHDEWTP